MSYINFVIPGNKSDLLVTSVSGEYYVNNVTGGKELSSELKSARSVLRDCGPEFIFDYFDLYYSVIYHGYSVPMDITYKAYEDLHKAVSELNKALGFVLEDKESLNYEVKKKYVNILKMLVYVYTQIVLLLEQHSVAKNDQLTRGRKKPIKDREEFIIDKRNILLILNNIIQREISLFWDPPVVEENFINLISGVCYELLQNSAIKNEKDVLTEVFNIIGYLIKMYNHGTTFVVRITQLIKLQEHLLHCIPKGIQQIVQHFNCRGLLHDMIEELTEWQTDDKNTDTQGARYCASTLSAMAALMPDLMLPEVMSLNSYLYHDPPSLRISVLMVMVEVILNNLSGHNLNDEQREFRDELLDILIEHINDVAVTVRAKVLQQWARFQKESAIPLKFQQRVLENVVEHLFDKGALARKAAAACVTTFLSYNAYSANLSLSAIQEELNNKEKMLNALKESIKDPKIEKLIELQIQWDANLAELKNTVQTLLNEEKENLDVVEHSQIPIDKVSDVIRSYLQQNKFKASFLICREALKDTNFLQKFQEANEESENLDLYLTILHSIFFDVTKIIGDIGNKQFLNISEEDLAKFSALETEVAFLQQCVDFLKVMDTAIDKMVELLETTSISDMQEAIDFFVVACQFNIDRASTGILAMLKLMQRNEQERKDAVVNAFKTIYLQTEASSITEHSTIIVGRLIKLVRTVSINNIDDLQDIIADWTAKGILDNAIIDMLWQYVTLRVQAKEDEVCAALESLRMAAIGRKTIISRNIDLVINIGFGERGRENMLLLGCACRLLSVSFERVSLTSTLPPFKLKPNNQCFKDLIEILISQFSKPVKFYNKGLYGAIDFVYKMCSKPEVICEDFLNNILISMHRKKEGFSDFNLPNYVLIRLCQMCGYIALKHLEFMDDTVYKELKRRNHVRDERKKEKNEKDSKKSKKKKDLVRKSVSANTASEANLMNSSMVQGRDGLKFRKILCELNLKPNITKEVSS